MITSMVASLIAGIDQFAGLSGTEVHRVVRTQRVLALAGQCQLAIEHHVHRLRTRRRGFGDTAGRVDGQAHPEVLRRSGFQPLQTSGVDSGMQRCCIGHRLGMTGDPHVSSSPSRCGRCPGDR